MVAAGGPVKVRTPTTVDLTYQRRGDWTERSQTQTARRYGGLFASSANCDSYESGLEAQELSDRKIK